jgi:4-hydroxy-3-methylbut-2-enyl diphosphate reductase
MKITLAKSAGFCFGVRHAVTTALETSTGSPNPVQMLGDIVHNERVVHQLDAAGIQVISSLDEAREGILVIRAHGAEPPTYKEARLRGLNIVDATCPLVTEIHQRVRELHADGYRVLVIGDHGHDEVKGIAAQVADALIVSSPNEVRMLNRKFRRLGVVVQSTQNVDNVKAIIAELIPLCVEIRFINTICYPTTKHQREIRTMPLENDVMIIVGSFTSANTKRMTEIARGLNPRSHQVTEAEDIAPEWFAGAVTVGVHAGASTPDSVIREVIERIQEVAGEPCEVC